MTIPNTAGLMNTEALMSLGNAGGIGTTQFSQAPGIFTRMLSGANSFLNKNLEPLSITMDQVGSRLNPDNPFAGVGTSLAKSSLANKAETKRNTQQQSIMKLLAALTGKGLPGGDKVSFSVGPNGELLANASMTLQKLSETPTQAPAATAQVAQQESPDAIMQRLQAKAIGD